ncbi:GntR family transcriptional regulator [Paenibacillus sp. GCM10027626]|uniref:GntR family transcriptional regulator n=1 Tax=Paenibacillus sp. GCM10027626 TaxID=3273411 RepID=UPI00362B4F83
MSRPSLRETAYQTLRGWISNEELKEGEVTSETCLAEKMDMSRTPVRAALQQLENEGFLRIVPKHGILILHASAQRISDLLETLSAIILFAYTHNMRSRPHDTMALIAEFMNQLVSAPSAAEIAAAEGGMWGRLIEQSQNQELTRLWHATLDKLQWHHNHRRWKPPYKTDTERELHRLLTAMTEGSESAISALFAYLQLWKKTWS